MLPGMGGRGGPNPKQVQRMMKQMGIEMEDVDNVEEVIIRTSTKEIRISPAEVQKITQGGQSSWQVVGDAKESPRGAPPARAPAPAPAPAPAQAQAPVAAKFTDADAKLVAEQAGVSIEQAKKALAESDGDLAEAIVKLSG